MERNTVSTDKAPAAIGPYSQGIAAGPWLFVSGQLGMDPQTGELVKGGLASQARQALKNLKAVVEAGGCALADVTGLLGFLDPIGSGRLFPSFFKTTDQLRLIRGVEAGNEDLACPCGESGSYIVQGSIQRIDLMDEAAAKLRVALYSLPPELKAMKTDIERLAAEEEQAGLERDYERAAEKKAERVRLE